MPATNTGGYVSKSRGLGGEGASPQQVGDTTERNDEQPAEQPVHEGTRGDGVGERTIAAGYEERDVGGFRDTEPTGHDGDDGDDLNKRECGKDLCPMHLLGCDSDTAQRGQQNPKEQQLSEQSSSEAEIPTLLQQRANRVAQLDEAIRDLLGKVLWRLDLERLGDALGGAPGPIPDLACRFF